MTSLRPPSSDLFDIIQVIPWVKPKDAPTHELIDPPNQPTNLFVEDGWMDCLDACCRRAVLVARDR